MTDTLGTYYIPDRNIDRLEEQLAKLNKRAKKLGVAPVTLTRLGFEDVKHECHSDSFSDPIGWCSEGRSDRGLCRLVGTLKRTWQVEVTGDTPKYAGYTFVATIEHLGDENIVRVVPGMELPQDYRTTDRICDHCKLVRNRRDTYVVQHEDGTYKQVGSDCLRDFLGHQNPQSLASWAEALGAFATDLGGASEDEDWGGYGSDASRNIVDGEEYLWHVAAIIRTRGWCSRAKAREEGGIATADRAFDNMFPTKEMVRHGDVVAVESIDKDAAVEALAWSENVLHEMDDADLNDYLHNLRAVTKSRAIERKHMGLFASLVPTARREGEKAERIEREKEERKERVHVGTVGKREVFKNLTVKRINAIDGYYGLTTVITFADPDGNSLVWFKSGSIDKYVAGYEPGQKYAFNGDEQGHWEQEYEVDATYDVKATVKKHNGDEKWGPQTVLTRVVKEVTR